jgi:hypothetical protein
LKALKTAVKIIGAVAAVLAVIPSPIQPIAAIVAAGAALVSTGLELAHPTRPQQPKSLGNPEDWRADPQAGVPICFGRSFFGGNIVHRDTYGTGNAILASVIVWSLGPVNAIESFSVERTAITFTGGNAVGAYHNFMYLTTQLGATPESAALVPSQGTLPNWNTASKLSGLAAGLLELKFDSAGKVFTTGFPQIGAVIQGVKCYDPRLDSTYPGGSGSCRSNNQATWVYSTNPFIQALTFAIGWVQNGVRVAGIGWPVASIDVARFVEGANVATANGWEGGGFTSTLESKWETLKLLLQAGAGEPVRLGGLLSCDFQTPRTSLATITASDLAGEGKVVATQPRRDRFNTGVGRYRSEAHGWEVVSTDPISVSAYVTTDGGGRTKELDYGFAQDLDQVAQLVAYEIVQSREFGPITLPLKPRWMGYKPGDAVTVTISDLGLSSQKCVIISRELDPGTSVVTLTLRSETDAKHAFALGTTTTAPPTPTLTPSGDPFVVTTAADLGITPGTAGRNLIQNGNAETGDVDPWIFDTQLLAAGGQPTPTLAVSAASPVPEGANKFLLTKAATGNGAPMLHPAIPVRPGRSYAYRVIVQGSSATGSGLFVELREKATEPASGYVGYADQDSGFSLVSNAAIPATATVVEGVYTCPAGVYFVSPTVNDWVGGPLSMTVDLVEFYEIADFGTDVGGTAKPEANAEVQADITGKDVIWIKTDSGGTPLTGQLTRSETYALREQGAVVASGVTWSITNSPAGITAGFSGTGQLDISAFSADEAELRIKAERTGREDRFYTVTVRRDKAAPPTTGGGGGGTGGSTASATVSTSLSSTTAVVLSPSDLVIDLGSVGSASLVASLEAAPDNVAPNGFWTVSIRFQRWNGSAWVDVGAGYQTAQSQRINDPDVGSHLVYSAYPTINDSYSGTPGATGEKFRLVGFLDAARTHSVGGSISVTGS